jgi:RNA recognition motif-containing protein
MRGLPFTTTSKEIANFFKDYDPIESSITLTCRSDGRATGEGYVAFKSPEDAQKAMTLNRGSIGSRYIELFISNEEEHTRSLSRSMGR